MTKVNKSTLKELTTTMTLCPLCGLPFGTDIEVNYKELCSLHLADAYNRALRELEGLKIILNDADDDTYDSIYSLVFPLSARLDLLEDLIKKDAMKRGLIRPNRSNK